MLQLLRAVALIAFLACGLTLIRPRSGWGRLAFFIPKLFAASRIVFFACLGLGVAAGGWLIYHDLISIGLGIPATIIGSRHVFRLVTRSHLIAGQLPIPSGDRSSSSSMLPHPWVVLWREPRKIPWQRDIAIARNEQTGDQIFADIWSPPASIKPSGLGIVFLHGSGWHYADKDFGTRHFFRHLATQGHVIIDLAYSLAPGVDLFGMIGDVKRTIVWAKQHADELRVRHDRVVLMGGSAGGHLALLAAYSPDHPRLEPPGLTQSTSVCAVVSYYGPADLRSQFDRFSELPALRGQTRLEAAFMAYLEARFGFAVIPVHSLLPSFLGGTPSDIPEIYDLASPSMHVSSLCPPSLLLHGTHDFSGVAPQARALHHALLNEGAVAYLLELPDNDHGFDLYKPAWSPAAQAATYVTERFLASLAWANDTRNEAG